MSAITANLIAIESGFAICRLGRKRRRFTPRACENSLVISRRSKKTSMDIERINLIGTQLADLTRRTEALRGYL
jgi:hypothetical protein